MKRRFTAVLMISLLIWLLLSGCGGRGLDENEMALQEDWVACLEANEQIHGILEWVFDYAQDFAVDNTWESMMRARAACDSAILALGSMDLPVGDLTAEQYDALLEQDVEADVVTMELNYLETYCGYKINTLQRLNSYLRDDIYLEPSAQQLSAWIDTNREILRVQYEYLCVTTNYLLLQMGDDALWEELPRRFPSIAGAQGQWSRDLEQLQWDCDAALDRGEELLKEEMANLGTSEYTLKIVQEAVSTGDYTRLAAMIHEMGDVPAYFPVPDWMPVESMWHYLLPDAQGDSPRFVEAGETIDQTPAACYISCGAVALEDVQQYAESLYLWGMEAYETASEDGKGRQVLVKSGPCTMAVSWTEEETILYLTEPVGCLIPPLYLLTMLLE